MILCCGEALIDMIPTVDVHGRNAYVPHPGGSVFNTAIALGRLGLEPGFLSGLSTDLFGKLIQNSLAECGVKHALSVYSDLPTTLAFIELNDGHAQYHFYDENTAGRMLTEDMHPPIPQTVSAIYFGGISLIVEPCCDFYISLAKRASLDKVVMVDPNIRQSFIRDVDRYRARLDTLLAACNILKVSDEDLDWIAPGPLSLLEKAKELRLKGPEMVILTRGKDGATAIFGDDEIVDVPARKAHVVDTVGAGDTFNAGVLAALSVADVLSKAGIENVTASVVKDVLEFGAQVAAINVSRSGANPPWAHELSGLIPPFQNGKNTV
ncbi:MAG: carbohydrate kinase [Marinobacter sp.]|uniref:carbohydrate kinase family protein n=1 Tax=Marinobacter sp. TaxID=50741 RepID=UPI001B5F2459|nr:carbohydrate kinase [Marinobacter sp.]MBQ0745524.1 carbohydrate kinase [Marinobacter sp.]MBQ0814167.1 carbohydrate kinase [Marinobacter sp.]|tara:strand:- start:1160 stop:2128 length:969 start_codon:yes stop_codon:yes gene_type:complete